MAGDMEFPPDGRDPGIWLLDRTRHGGTEDAAPQTPAGGVAERARCSSITGTAGMKSWRIRSRKGGTLTGARASRSSSILLKGTFFLRFFASDVARPRRRHCSASRPRASTDGSPTIQLPDTLLDFPRVGRTTP